VTDAVSGARAVAVSGNNAYVVGGSGFQVIDIVDLTDPLYEGGYETSALDIAVVGDHVFLASGDLGLQVFDIRDPEEPRRVGRLRTTGYAYDLEIVGNRAFLNGEFDDESGSSFHVIDISDPTNPVRVGGHTSNCIASDLTVVGNQVFVAAGACGLQVFDLSPLPISLTLLPMVENQQTVRLNLSGPAGMSLNIQRSDNLVDWQDWQNIVLSNQPNEVEDTEVPAQSGRYYRGIAR
jgi:hypothetical protein